MIHTDGNRTKAHAYTCADHMLYRSKPNIIHEKEDKNYTIHVCFKFNQMCWNLCLQFMGSTNTTMKHDPSPYIKINKKNQYDCVHASSCSSIF